MYLHTRVSLKLSRFPIDQHTLNGFLTEAQHLSWLIHPQYHFRVPDFGVQDDTPFRHDHAPGGNLRQHHPPGQLCP